MRIRNIDQRWRGLSHHAAKLLAVVAIATLAACGSSDDDNNNFTPNPNTSTTGKVLINLTDAQGDFIRYKVNVQTLTLTKADGAIVNTLADPVAVDFADVTQVTENLVSATVPTGQYTNATVVLDFSDADIQVEGADGNAVKVENIQDSAGNPLGTLQATVQLENQNALVVVPETTVTVTVDFNVPASNTVTFDENDVPTVTVEPFLVADVNVQEPQQQQLRGVLKSVDVGNNTFVVSLRPFTAPLDITAGDRFGDREVTVTSETVYEIDGATLDASTGLDTLAASGSLAAVEVIGELKTNPIRFEAQQVFAGSSVPGGNLDAAEGNIIARSGDQLTLKGATLIRAGGTVVFNDTIQVIVGAATQITRQGSVDAELTNAAISVGQRLLVFGTVSEDTTTGIMTMDATNSQARLLVTDLRGIVNSTSEGGLVLNLQSISGRAVSLFDFSGTGTTPEQDADPANYEIGTGLLDLSSLVAGAPAQASGFTAPFAAAPPDFNAETVVDVALTTARLEVDWQPASTTPFTAASATGITLDLTGVQRGVVLRGGVATDLTALTGATVVVPGGDGTGEFLIKENDVITLHTAFDSFINDLQGRLGAGLALRLMSARGNFDDASTTLSSNDIAVSLETTSP